MDNGAIKYNLSLSGMDNSDATGHVDGGCLCDSTDDGECNVDDFEGNLSVSQWVWANTTSCPFMPQPLL